VREVGLNSHRGVERVGFMGRRNWEARRQKRVHGGVGGQVYVGVPLKWSGRRGGKAIITQ